MADPIVLSYHDSLLRQSDMRLLDPPNWLNDRLIGFCFQYFEYDLFPDQNYAYISPDVAQFVKLSSLAELDIFLSPLDLKSKDLIFLPVNDNSSASVAGGGHWSLLVYFSKTNEFCHYDSSGQFNTKAAKMMTKQLGRYLDVDANFVYKKSPQQQNSHDCGVYVVCMTEFLCSMYRGQSTGNMSAEVTAATVGAKRAELKKLITNLGNGKKR